MTCGLSGAGMAGGHIGEEHDTNTEYQGDEQTALSNPDGGLHDGGITDQTR